MDPADDSATAADQSQLELQAGGSGDENKADPARKKQNVRKRTKTGCLTCRKRRIKCDECRPICNNCIKSKRQCEGYNQRVVFKEPLGNFQGGPFGPMAYPPQPNQFFSHASQGQLKQTPQQTPFPIIAPKPPPLDFRLQPQLQYGQAYHTQPQPASASSSTFNFNHVPHPGATQLAFVPREENVPGFSPLASKDAAPSQDYLPTPHTADGSFSERVFPLERQHLTPPAGPMSVSPELHDHVGASNGRAQWETALSDDDISMGESDDEIREGEDPRLRVMVANQLDGPLAGFGTNIRSFSAYATNNFLTSYVPSAQNSPLNDPRTAAVFFHFANVTGPSMSIYERHPMDQGVLDASPPAIAGHSIWTYTFPIISFQHPALLQAILALGALQISQLRRIPATAAMKHYHLAIRRVAKNVKSQARRTHAATIAASLLLAYFEVWNSDHDNWCKHMYGSSLLFREVPLKQMSKIMLQMKRRRRREMRRMHAEPLDHHFMPGYAEALNNDRDLDNLDVNLLRVITGLDVRHEDLGQGQPEEEFEFQSNGTTDRDIENYEHLRDLWWWYTKMDVYQSVLGGTKLFTDYEEWLQCPPRAPIGRLEAIYGTFDHLMLLLGRSSQFGAKDMSRKRQLNKSKGSWAFFGTPGGPGGRGGPSRSSGGPGTSTGFGGPAVKNGSFGPGGPFPNGPPPGASPPMFAGMVPTNKKVSLPMGFSPPRETTPASEGAEELDADQQLQAAVHEWESIRMAFERLRMSFGPEFEPLAREFSDNKDSPFGPTLQYRTFSVAGIWLNYYMGLIHLYRSHPSMPPATMIAAGFAAQQTAEWANTIGRISAGLADDTAQMTEISTLVGAALIESSFCLFVAGVQFQDEAQRYWLIRRLHDVTRLTGWQSARMIAEGCEVGWARAFAVGRGPPYIRPQDVSAQAGQESVWESPRRINRKVDEMQREGRIVMVKSEQTHFAVGLLGFHELLDKLTLSDTMNVIPGEAKDGANGDGDDAEVDED